MVRKNFFKGISAVALVGTLTLTTSNLAFAKSVSNLPSLSNLPSSSANLSNLKISSEARNSMKKMADSGLLKDFKFDKNGKLVLKDSIADAKIKYSLNDSDVNNLKKMLAFAQQRKSINISSQSKSKVISPNVYVSNWKVYFSNEDVNAYLFAAAETGPEALAAALDGLATLMGGPVGTVIGVVLDVLGASALARLCYLIIQAEVNDQGIYIGINWNGGFPNYTDGNY
ncbi:hypothetical protein [Clostridium hydrogenum]|uniref:hypothetical protein n=1 Tax=Clostridium hydrogenum TaxID=2855764 RepID=UPI001F355802|nr:hypothetical protein [Clostridium hydrogenum]